MLELVLVCIKMTSLRQTFPLSHFAISLPPCGQKWPRISLTPGGRLFLTAGYIAGLLCNYRDKSQFISFISRKVDLQGSV